ncbi:MAG: peptide ABC transporter substrate-binding protein [Anaerolineales bacterium]|nr:peptide ABC transporter substrate-binding protein [Anaerolineales bacterium]MCB8991078.1 peptide ABC transporter substrate-binding protein [Ardenticatenaceae bacterium]MCB9004120.1 peptide ABC transporter substrate-binding protein [Ardenticatenaceae bacterium]
MSKNRIGIAFVLFVLLTAVIITACSPTIEERTVEVTRLVTETVEVGGDIIEVTRIVTETVPATPVPTTETPVNKDLVVCMAQEPDTMYIYGGTMLAARHVQHAVFENDITLLSYDYQAQGIEKLPSLADGDAFIEEVEVNAGDLVLDSSGNPVTLEEGVEVSNAAGEAVVFDGTPIMMQQLVTDFTMKPRVWSDGTPVTTDDSVFSFELTNDPDTPSTKFLNDRTASYETTGDLSVRWTGIPGFMDPTYFTNFWPPLPRHILGGYTAAEMLEAEESSRVPIGDGPFAIVEWVAGDSIYMEPNPYYYRQDEGLPYLDSVTFKFIPDTNQLVAQMLSGQCDIGTQDGLNVSQSPFLIEAEASGLLVPYFQTGTVFEHIDFGIDSYGDYGDGVGRPDWFEDVRVRRAMTMCTDRQSMVDNILYGRSEVIHTFIPTVHPLYPEEGLTEWPYDVEAANALLDEAGYLDSDGDGIREDPATGTPFAVGLGTTTGNDMRQQLTQIFKENLLECGIDIELYYLSANEWFANGPEGPLFGRRFDLGEFAWSTGVQPSCNLYTTDAITGPEDEGLGGWGNSNDTGWSNEEYDRVCNIAQASLPGTPEYEDNHKEAQRIFSDEVPIIPLFLRLKVAATRPDVLNFQIDPTQNSELWNIFEIDLE